MPTTKIRTTSNRAWLSKLKALVARGLCSPAIAFLVDHATGDDLTFLGIQLNTSDPAFTSRTKAQIFWGVYEAAEGRFMREYLQGADVVVELGSSLGATGALLANTMAERGTLICVEANPDLSEVLRSTVMMHSPPELEVRFVNAAIGGQSGSIDFFIAPDSVASSITPMASRSSVAAVRSVTLDALLEEQGVRDYTLVSDIEGAEASFIMGESDGLTGCRRIVVELHDTEWDGRAIAVEEMVDRLMGYHGFSILARRGRVLALDRPQARNQHPL